MWKSKLCQSVSLSWYRAYGQICSSVRQLRVFWYGGCPLWREDGSVIYNFCWNSPAQLISARSPAGLITILYSLKFGDYPKLKVQVMYLYLPRTGRPTCVPRHWAMLLQLTLCMTQQRIPLLLRGYLLWRSIDQFPVETCLQNQCLATDASSWFCYSCFQQTCTNNNSPDSCFRDERSFPQH
jgi:hypothetical protein